MDVRIKSFLKDILYAGIGVYLIFLLFFLFKELAFSTFFTTISALILFGLSPFILVRESLFSLIPIVLLCVVLYALCFKVNDKFLIYRKYILFFIFIDWVVCGGVSLTIFTGG